MIFTLIKVLLVEVSENYISDIFFAEVRRE